mgnify:CR=1 FL=1
MIKLNQPLTLTLTVNDVSTATSATIEYRKPSRTTGEWTATLDTGAATVSYDIPADILDEVGTWLVIAVVTFASGDVIPGEAHAMTVRSRFE